MGFDGTSIREVKPGSFIYAIERALPGDVWLPGEYYHWHVDSGPGEFRDRQLVAIRTCIAA